MAYQELVKNFERIRDYMREFYVYGFKSRSEYHAKSARSYDNERRRIESWLGEYTCFRQDASGKRVYLSVDSRRIPHNPLYKAFKAKSFTAKDITLHFYILDLLADGAMTASQLTDAIAGRCLTCSDGAWELDESTVRKKLKEYAALGLLASEKRGRVVEYRRTDDSNLRLDSWADALAFFSEEAPVGVIGSFLLDRLEVQNPLPLCFKHHYILHALDSEILFQLLDAIGQQRAVELTVRSLRNGNVAQRTACPLKLYSSTQTGRQYLLCYLYRTRRMMFYRLDAIKAVQTGSIEPHFDDFLDHQAQFDQHLWGVSTGRGFHLDHIEMTVHVDDGEEFIIQRLWRERRHGTVEFLDSHTYKFTADVYDATEMLPWLRTFTGRIVSLQCSNPSVSNTFYQDLEIMRQCYRGDSHAVP